MQGRVVKKQHSSKLPYMLTVLVAFVFMFAMMPKVASAEPTKPAPKEDDKPKVLQGQIEPELSIDIPYVQFSKITIGEADEEGGTDSLNIPWIAEYFTGIYKFAVGIAGALAGVMIMIGGFQYLTAGGDAARVGAAKKRISDALVGMMLTLGAFFILNAFSPDLVNLKSLQIAAVTGIQFEFDNSDEDGVPDGGDVEKCEWAKEQAKENGTCAIADGIGPPVAGRSASCNYHFKKKDYDYKQMKGIDTVGRWDDVMLATVTGTVKIVTGSPSQLGGNCVIISATGGGGSVSQCHMKDFMKAGNTVALKTGDIVTQGDQIGHVGGKCCKGQVYPDNYKGSSGAWCKFEGNECGKGFEYESNCECQRWQEAGNTTGPHVHITLSSKKSDLLACTKF